MKTASTLKGQRRILKGLEGEAKHRGSRDTSTKEEPGKSDRKGDGDTDGQTKWTLITACHQHTSKGTKVVTT